MFLLSFIATPFYSFPGITKFINTIYEKATIVCKQCPKIRYRIHACENCAKFSNFVSASIVIGPLVGLLGLELLLRTKEKKEQPLLTNDILNNTLNSKDMINFTHNVIPLLSEAT